MKFKTKCYGHQLECFEYGMAHEQFLLADEQGLGKTKESIDIAVGRKLYNQVQKCLIICGVNSTKYNWQNEIGIHSDEQSVLIDGTKAKRLKAIKEWGDGNAYFGIINIEALRQDDILEQLKLLPIEMIILDEIHKCKNPMSKQGKVIHTLKAKYRIGLTGTPIQNKAVDVYNILKWLGAENRNFYAFRNRYCIMGNFRNIVGYKNLHEVHAILNRVMLRRLKNEVLDLPPKIYKKEFVELTAKQKLLYRQSKASILEMLNMGINIPDNPLTVLMTMRKVTGGLLTEDNPKMDRLKELLNDYQEENKKAIVFSNYKEVTRKIKEQLESEGYKILYIDGDTDISKRQEQVEIFQNSNDYNIIIGTIGAMGTGLTLNKAEAVIFYDKHYNPSENEQAEDRAHRIGTMNRVNVITLVAKDTVDERIEKLLVEKKKVIDEVIEGKQMSNRDVLDYLLKD
jgi:SNF2 family DNA or RNA helicase